MESDMKIHFLSLVTGIAAAVCLTVFMAADRPAFDPARFELEATQNHVFVLDRYSGRVWQKFVSEGSGQTDQDFSQPKIR